MSDYKYIKFTDLVAINGQTERVFPLFGLKRVVWDTGSPFDFIKIDTILSNQGESSIQIEVRAVDGSQFTDTGTPGLNDTATYIAFCNEILDFYFGLTSTNKIVTTVKAGANGDIAPTLGLIRQVTITG